MSTLYGYAGKLFRVDLSRGTLGPEELDEGTARSYLGGAGIGAKCLYDEIPPGVEWNHPQNRLILASGPLGGTRVGGSGSFSVATKGALTNGATATQANGFFGAFLKFSGFDGIIVQGASAKWVYLYIHDGTAELRDASHLLGLDTWETDDRIKAELGFREKAMSVLCVGPAGENLVRFAAICGDKGHVAAHNGVGAVMGSKRLKAIAVARGKSSFPIYDKDGLSRAARQLLENIKKDPALLETYNWGTLNGVIQANKGGFLPVKNYTTNIYAITEEKLGKFAAPYIREHFKAKPNPCWACQFHHCHMMEIPEGPYQGQIIEEPEYENFAAWGPAIGQTEVATTMWLANLVDRLGFDTNESGWVVSWVMECYQKGLLTRADTDGLEMTWGNAEATITLLHRIARRQGIGNALAEGVMRAAQWLGGEAKNLAIHTMKGNTPHGGDHRSVWPQMFDTAVSNTGSLETSRRRLARELFGLLRRADPFSPEDIATTVAKTKGSMQFEDSLGVCYFNTRTDMHTLCQAVQAATGWDYIMDEAMTMGRRAVNLMRAFNLRHGLSPQQDAPSPRYGSTPVDGVTQGKSILPHWEGMLQTYYRLMGWDEKGWPLAKTLQRLGLDQVAADLAGMNKRPQ